MRHGLRRRVGAALGGAACLVALAACGGDDASGTDPLEVEVGEEFTWNDFTVQEGWTVSPVERNAGMEMLTSPEISGTVVNNSDETRFALFEVVFSRDGEDLATVNCASMELVEDQSAALSCPGLGQSMPEDYDRVLVEPIERVDGEDTTDS